MDVGGWGVEEGDIMSIYSVLCITFLFVVFVYRNESDYCPMTYLLQRPSSLTVI